jgi:tetratricopeptide (TPR) repeat protein
MDRMTLDAEWRKARHAEQQGDLRAALGHYRELARRFPSHPDLLFDFARAAAQSGEYQESRTQFETLLRLAPQDVAAWAQLGFVCSRMSDFAGAENALANAIRLDPQAPALRINYALVQKQQGKTEAARRELETVLQMAPDNVLALYNLGNLWRDAAVYDRAEECYRRTLAIDARHVDSLYNLACLLRDHDEFAEAQALFEAAVRLRPGRFDAWHNLANLRRVLGDLKGARAAYQAALSGGEWALPRYALGTLDLMEGNWSPGWDGYEARWEANHMARPQLHLPLWQGEDVSRESRLLVRFEQGYGDCIQFVRFLPLLARRFGHVGMHCPTPLIRLFRQSFGDEFSFFENLPAEQVASYTHYIPVMSLGRALRVDEPMLGTIPVPYLRAGAPRRFLEEGALRIGFTWTGNPAHAENIRRSISPPALASLFSIKGTRWCSLQRGLGRELMPWRDRVCDDSDAWQDFADMANFIAGLDLVITVCTAQAHLAGALGKPVWLMSRFDTDWRWQLDRTDSPWYPSVRIFRQPVRGDWGSVIENVGAALWAKTAEAARS